MDRKPTYTHEPGYYSAEYTPAGYEDLASASMAVIINATYQIDGDGQQFWKIAKIVEPATDLYKMEWEVISAGYGFEEFKDIKKVRRGSELWKMIKH